MTELTLVEISAGVIIALMGAIFANFQIRIRELEGTMPKNADARLTALENERSQNAIIGERLTNVGTALERLTDQVTNGDAAIFHRINDQQTETTRWRNEVYAADMRVLNERINDLRSA